MAACGAFVRDISEKLLPYTYRYFGTSHARSWLVGTVEGGQSGDVTSVEDTGAVTRLSSVKAVV